MDKIDDVLKMNGMGKLYKYLGVCLNSFFDYKHFDTLYNIRLILQLETERLRYSIASLQPVWPLKDCKQLCISSQKTVQLKLG